MPGTQKKILGEERRELILQWLKTENKPMTGSELSKRTNVSRQVIVQNPSQTTVHQRIIACQHTPEDAEKELLLLVDHGVLVKDVTVEHPVYGELTASVMIQTRKEVETFIEKIQETNATYLSQLTDGIHLHTIEADTIEKLNAACLALEAEGYLVSNE